MSNNLNIMSPRGFKAGDTYYPSPIAIAFSALLTALDQHTEAEREIEDVDIWDPAFKIWLTDAETKLSNVTMLITEIAAKTPICVEDKPLKRMSMLIDHMIGSEDPNTFRNLHQLLPKFDGLFRCAGCTLAASHANRMLETAHTHINAMAGLLTYDADVEDAVPEPDKVIATI